jgi:hypothetical protein
MCFTRGVNGVLPVGGVIPRPTALSIPARTASKSTAERGERLSRDTLGLLEQCEQEVLGPDVVVVPQARFGLRQHDHVSGAWREPLEHVGQSVLPDRNPGQ